MSVYLYWKTTDEDGRVSTHLSEAGDHSICGHDLAGDDMVHSKPPEALEGKHRVTCQHCLQIIELVKLHLKKS